MVKSWLSYRWFILVFLCTARSLYGQVDRIDSLKTLLTTAKDSQQRFDTYCNLAYGLFDSDDSLALHYATAAKAEAERVNNLAGIKYANTLIGIGLSGRGDYLLSLESFKTSKNGKGPVDPVKDSYNLMLMGNSFRDLAYYDSATYYYKEAIRVIGKNENTAHLGSYLRCLATIDMLLWRTNQAFANLKRAEELTPNTPQNSGRLKELWFIYSILNKKVGRYDEAKKYSDRICSSANNSDYFYQIRCHLTQAEVALRKGELKDALREAFEALKISKIYKFPQERVWIYGMIAEIYSELSQFSLASQYYFQSIKISEEHGLSYETAINLTQIAWVYKQLNNFPLAVEYLDKSNQINERIGNKDGLAKNKNIRGLIFLLQKKYSQALDEFDRALELRTIIDNQIGISAVLYNKSLVYESLGDFENALRMQKQALLMEEKIDSKIDLGISYNSIASLLIRLKKISEAQAYLKKALDLATHTNSKMLKRNTLLHYSQYYELKGDLQSALRVNKEVMQLNDSIYSINSSVKLAEMQALYQVETKEQEIHSLAEQRKIQEAELASERLRTKQQNTVIVVSLVAIVLLLIAGIISVRFAHQKNLSNEQLKKLNRAILEQKEEIQAQSEELIEASETISNINKDLELRIEESTSDLKQAYKELDTFFYRSSHDFRRPITTFLGLAGVAKITVKDPVSLELFEKVSETATSLDKMLQKLQSISDLGSQQMIYKEVLLKELVREIVDSYSPQISKAGISIQLDIDDQIPLISYPAMLKIVLENLIENSIHFSIGESPQIKVKIKVELELAKIEVSDNGQGILDEYKSRVFEMYYRANEKSKGNGLGLYITKKAVEKLNGKISFESKHGVGSTFSVNLPNTKA